MSGSSFMERYGLPSARNPLAKPNPEVSDGAEDQTAEQASEAGCCGILRGARDRAVMLELRSKTGSVRAIPYAWIERIDFDPSEGITIRVAGSSIRINGRNLAADSGTGTGVFAAICRQRAIWLRECPRTTALDASADEAVVESIEWD